MTVSEAAKGGESGCGLDFICAYEAPLSAEPLLEGPSSVQRQSQEWKEDVSVPEEMPFLERVSQISAMPLANAVFSSELCLRWQMRMPSSKARVTMDSITERGDISVCLPLHLGLPAMRHRTER